VSPTTSTGRRRDSQNRRRATSSQNGEAIHESRDEGREQHNQNDENNHSDRHYSSAPSRLVVD
jgi:hypothetical protein